MKFSVTIEIEVEERGHILSSSPKDHTEDIADFFNDMLYDVDDLTVTEIEVRKSR